MYISTYKAVLQNIELALLCVQKPKLNEKTIYNAITLLLF